MFVFSDIDKFGRIQAVDLKKYNGQLILYGAGKVADVVDFVLRQQGIEYLCYCDTYRSGETRNGHEVISLDDLRDKYVDLPILITTIHHRSVVEILKDYGEREIFDCVSLLSRVDFSDWGKCGEKMTPVQAERVITSYLSTRCSEKCSLHYNELSVMVTQKCNLCCIDCSEMIPMFRNPRHYDADLIIQSLKNLDSYEEISFHDLTFLGGETLLYFDLCRVLEYAISMKRIHTVSIITNATMLPMQELIPLMQNKRFLMRISDYGELSRKKTELIAFCDKNNIRYDVSSFTEWCAHSKHLVDDSSENEATRKYNACTNIKHLRLIDGRIYPCYKAGQLCQLGAFEINDNNSIDCLTAENLYDCLSRGLKHFRECDHIDICHQCTGIVQIQQTELVPPARQGKGPLDLIK